MKHLPTNIKDIEIAKAIIHSTELLAQYEDREIAVMILAHDELIATVLDNPQLISHRIMAVDYFVNDLTLNKIFSLHLDLGIKAEYADKILKNEMFSNYLVSDNKNKLIAFQAELPLMLDAEFALTLVGDEELPPVLGFADEGAEKRIVKNSEILQKLETTDQDEAWLAKVEENVRLTLEQQSYSLKPINPNSSEEDGFWHGESFEDYTDDLTSDAENDSEIFNTCAEDLLKTTRTNLKSFSPFSMKFFHSSPTLPTRKDADKHKPSKISLRKSF